MPKRAYTKRKKMSVEEFKEKRRKLANKWRKANAELVRERKNASYAKNPEPAKRRAKAYREKNPEHCKARSTEYQAAHREELKQYHREYYQKNKEALREKQRQYNTAHREELAAHQSEWYRVNRDKVIARTKAYYKQHPEVFRASSRKRTALKSQSSVADVRLITAWEMKWKARRLVKCHWCSKRCPSKVCHVDHVVPLSKGGEHAVENLCISCATCNLKKNNNLPEVWNKRLKQPLLFM